MLSHEEELEKIERATAGTNRTKAQSRISTAISSLRPQVEEARALPEGEREEAIKRLLKDTTAARHKAVENGAASHDHPEWAAAAVCESWLMELLTGSPESIARIEAIVARLQSRPDKQSRTAGQSADKTDWLPILFLLVVLPVAFTWGGIWIGLVVLIVGVVWLGWSKRHHGPF